MVNRLLLYRKKTLGQYLRAASPNLDAVEASGYGEIPTGTKNVTVAEGGRYFITMRPEGRIRQAGTVESVTFYVPSTYQVDMLWFYIWRKTGAAWAIVGREDLRPKYSAAGIVTVTLTTPIAVEVGDYIGYGGDGAVGHKPLFAIIGAPANSSYFIDMTAPTAPTDWTTGTGVTFWVPFKVNMRAPAVVMIGDSVTAGHPANYSYIETTATNDATSDPSQLIAAATRCTIQNMGIGGQNSTEILARFAADVVALKPKVCVIECGMNDVVGGATQATYIANMTTMLDLCRANAILPVFVALPWTNATDEQSATYEGFVDAVRGLLRSYPDGTFVDARPALGTGTNYRDIKAEYNADGVHYNAAGYAAMAQAILNTRVGA